MYFLSSKGDWPRHRHRHRYAYYLSIQTSLLVIHPHLSWFEVEIKRNAMGSWQLTCLSRITVFGWRFGCNFRTLACKPPPMQPEKSYTPLLWIHELVSACLYDLLLHQIETHLRARAAEVWVQSSFVEPSPARLNRLIDRLDWQSTAKKR